MGDADERRFGNVGRCAMKNLAAMPALVVLERFSVPVLAVCDDGTVLFANTAFAEMVGQPLARVEASTFADLLAHVPSDSFRGAAAVRAKASVFVDLRHADGSTVRARMSRSALLGDDDHSVAVTTFQDLTEQLWIDEP